MQCFQTGLQSVRRTTDADPNCAARWPQYIRAERSCLSCTPAASLAGEPNQSEKRSNKKGCASAAFADGRRDGSKMSNDATKSDSDLCESCTSCCKGRCCLTCRSDVVEEACSGQCNRQKSWSPM